MISNSSICDVERKGRKKDNNKNVNKDKDKDKDNLIDKLLNNKDKLHNFSDKVLNNLTNIAKLKGKILINKKKVEETNVPLKDIRSNLDKYKELNILYDDLVNHVWRMIFGKSRVNNETDINCDIVEDAKTYLNKYIKILSDKQVLIYSVSESIDELMEGLDVNSSNDTTTKEVKDFKKAVIKSIDKFNSYIKQETKKRDTAKEHIEKVNAKKNSTKHDANNKPATNANI